MSEEVPALSREPANPSVLDDSESWNAADQEPEQSISGSSYDHVSSQSQNSLQEEDFHLSDTEREDDVSVGDMQMDEEWENQEESIANAVDYSESVKGLYRVLDLISERGSGGLVDKIIISQESLGRFISDVAPGAYTSVTKIDFELLDRLHLRPVGIYGSRSEILRFMQANKAIDDDTIKILLEDASDGNDTKADIRSGLYFFLPDLPGSLDIVYVIYWPELTTWEDNAISSVQRNRVTFMRYLLKLAGHVVSLISRDHLDQLIWKDDEDEDEDWDSDDGGREYNFEVSKSEEQAEDVFTKPGFILQNPMIGRADSTSSPYSTTCILIPGETQIGVMELSHVAPVDIRTTLNEAMYSIRLSRAISSCSFELSANFSSASLDILIRHGLERRAPSEVAFYKSQMEKIESDERDSLQAQMSEMRMHLETDAERVMLGIQTWLEQKVRDEFGMREGESWFIGIDNSPDYINQLQLIIPEISQAMNDGANEKDLNTIATRDFGELKNRIVSFERLFGRLKCDNEQAWVSLVQAFFGGPTDDHFPPLDTMILPPEIAMLLPHSGTRLAEDIIQTRMAQGPVSDKRFLQTVRAKVGMHSHLEWPVQRAFDQASATLRQAINRKALSLASEVRIIREREMSKRIRRAAESRRSQSSRDELNQFLAATQTSFIHRHSRQLWCIEEVKVVTQSFGHSDLYRLLGTNRKQLPARIRHYIHPLQLTAEDRQNLQTINGFVPTPKIHARSSTSVRLDLNETLLHAQLLQHGQCLLVIADGSSNIRIYLDRLADLSDAVWYRHYKKHLHHERIGPRPLIAFDETKRSLAILPMDPSLRHLYLFVFDERFTNLQASGAPMRIGEWYDDSVTITHMAFVCGASEEIVLVDDTGNARVFSWITQQPRPNTLQVSLPVSGIFSSPDGSCFLVQSPHTLRAHHWSTFGTTAGIDVHSAEGHEANSSVITSFGGRSNIHFVTMQPIQAQLRSLSLTITHKVTEFAFREKSGVFTTLSSVSTKHNSLIDCHADVWTRFPVVPALRRSLAVQKNKDTSLSFVADHSHHRFRGHFKGVISAFEKRTRKPTDNELEHIMVTSGTFGEFMTENHSRPAHSVPAGEWLVELLCLIPIHIALAHDNRFIPLKDGVWSADYERQLAGARVDEIVDSISFGWYESIFGSYMANKPVKVVSSMGEQSVGKSFTLNHLVDTSFAGSAMRTTEGVWMSVTPTAEALIVALDFEGVHSVERSAQEDALLVLFNTAISNLVLFRNNFAISRDIAGLFQSFQSSSTILDPRANPSLFCSKLVIIIKDVVQSDKDDIKKEFQLKFQQIVEMEQAANFITRLHRNNLAIMPWPVIESKQFYTLFKRLRQSLEDQPVTHENTVIFLQTIKTLMAKIKANDWGSLSQNLAAHRVRQLLSILPTALAYGRVDKADTEDVLRNLDTGDQIVSEGDSSYAFFMSEHHDVSPEDRHDLMSLVHRSWDQYTKRTQHSESSWIEGLQDYLEKLALSRISHVNTWISVNLARFTDHGSITDGLFRDMERLCVDLRSCLKLCGRQCSQCQLLCIQHYQHESIHDCTTSHICAHSCKYSEEHGNEEQCGLPAGHAADHICNISAHLCGKTCKLSDKHGCLERCAKPVNHSDEDHMCPAMVHECSQPCSLQRITTAGGHQYTCYETCRRPSDEPHEVHICDTQGCPLQCQLCKRTCDSPNHLHALDPQSAHLCREQHSCSALCQSLGVCQIETTPHSMDATFTGKYGAFQYTKYSQSAKRLPCILPIPTGQLTHDGLHQHNMDNSAKHFCETRCTQCGYYCTLSLGHQELEHDTSHGSMSSTRWVIGGDGHHGDDSIIVNGHTFGAEDEGAPMLCSLVCKSLGRHVHVDYCRGNCQTDIDLQHLQTPMAPDLHREKDWVTHTLHWRRTGFKDPYTQEELADFAKCDSMCTGPEHRESGNTPARPSYCTQPLFHTPITQAPSGPGYVSGDGHHFRCANPNVAHQNFHVIFLIDKSQSMGITDRGPLASTPVTARIRQNHNNRLGAVYSSLYSFWTARHALAANQRDAYTVILFDENVTIGVINDTTSSAETLLKKLLPHTPQWRTNFQSCIDSARSRMSQNWHARRAPVVVLLSDGEANVPESQMRRLCRTAVERGKALSFHAISFGPHNASLRRLVDIAAEVQAGQPRDPARPMVPSSYSEAQDTIQLAETFLGIAESLRKPRGALMRA